MSAVAQRQQQGRVLAEPLSSLRPCPPCTPPPTKVGRQAAGRQVSGHVAAGEPVACWLRSHGHAATVLDAEAPPGRTHRKGPGATAQRAAAGSGPGWVEAPLPAAAAAAACPCCPTAPVDQQLFVLKPPCLLSPQASSQAPGPMPAARQTHLAPVTVIVAIIVCYRYRKTKGRGQGGGKTPFSRGWLGRIGLAILPILTETQVRTGRGRRLKTQR